MRRLALGAAVGVILALTAAVGVSAHWHAQQRLQLGTVSSGDLSIDATWLAGPPVWGPLYPGASTSDAVIRVTSTGAGTTMRWNLTLSGSTAAEFSEYTTIAAWQGACGTGTPLPVKNLPPSSVTDLCVRVMLKPGAPSSLQGKAVTPRFIVIAEQAVTP